MQSSDTIAPTSEDHAVFDAQWVRALAQEGYCRWYLKPRVDTTTLTSKSLQMQVQALLPQILGQLPGRRLAQHLAYLIVQNSMSIHMELSDVDMLLSKIRCAMIQVSRGAFMVEGEDPLLPYSSPQRQQCTEGGVVKIKTMNTLKANTDEKKAAAALVGNPGLVDDLSVGPLSNMLRTSLSNLLTLNKNNCLELAFELRLKIHRLIAGRDSFDPELRAACVNELLTLWDKIQTPDRLHTIITKIREDTGLDDPLDLGPSEMMNRYLNPVLSEPEVLRERLAALELATFVHAASPDNEETNARLSVLWEAVFPNTRSAFCDTQSNALAYLASLAAGRPLEKFRKEFGPAPVLTLLRPS